MFNSKTVATVSMVTFALVAMSGVAHADANVITGKVIFKGNAGDYKRKVIDTSKDPNCKKAKTKIGSQKVIINKKTTPMTLRNVLVSIKDGLGNKMFPTPSEPVVLTQFGCQYKPHVFGIVAGQKLKILNGDNTNHNIHFLPKKNQEHNFTQPKKDMENGKVITLVEEDVFKVKCDVHPWMGCHIGVFKHPFFNVTGKDGTFTLTGMPDGTYTLEAWHEEFGKQTASVTVEGGTANVDLTFEPGA